MRCPAGNAQLPGNDPYAAAGAQIRKNTSRPASQTGISSPGATKYNRIANPNEDTITTILGLVDKDEINEKRALFLIEMIEKRSVVAIDGKALRDSEDYVLSIFINEISYVVWQENVEKKQNKLSALENVLGTILEIYPQIKLFTGNASFYQKKFAKTFIKARRNYFLHLKSPHNTDVELAKDAYRQISPAMPPATRTLDKRGARKGRKS